MIILASNSPRRREILTLLGFEFTVISADVDESVDTTLSPEEITSELSRRKASAVFSENKDSIVIGSDTVVALDGVIFGKPKSTQEAREMLKKLSGKTHCVYTGVTVISSEKSATFCDIAEVVFDEISDAEIEEYISTDEPYDKAGGYGIQGSAAKFIKEIHGDFYTVMGLPSNRLYRTLKSFTEGETVCSHEI